MPVPPGARSTTRRALRTALVLTLALALAAAAAPRPDAGPAGPASAARAATGDPLVYAVDAVDGKLLRLATGTADAERRLAAGDRVTGGSELRTGWFSSAELAAARARSRFHLGSRTHVRLASETPGVLLVLERGRLRALFDALTGDEEPEERRIETPSAILAVRGTEYGVAVGRGGATTLVVFEGVVEVLDPTGRTAPVQVTMGQALHLRRGEPPSRPFAHGLNREGWDRGATPPMSGPGGPPSAPGTQRPERSGPEGPSRNGPQAGPHGGPGGLQSPQAPQAPRGPQGPQGPLGQGGQQSPPATAPGPPPASPASGPPPSS